MSGAYEQFSIYSDLAELDRLFEFLEGFCARHGVADETRHRLFLVTEELAVNAIEHGYRGRSDGRIQIGLRRDARHVELSVEDECPRFDPLAEVPAPDVAAAIDDRPIGGLGIHFVKSLTLEAAYRFEDGHNVVRAVLAAGE